MSRHGDRASSVRSFLARAWSWLKGIEFSLLFSLALIVGGIWLFILVADELVAEGPRSFDEQILLALREPGDLYDPIGPLWLETAMRDLTALGGTAVLTLATLGVVGYFALRRRWYLVGLVLLTVLGGTLLTLGAKQLFGRVRPTLVPPLTDVGSLSFPSGHSSLAATIYLTLGVLIARVQGRRRLRLYVVSIAMLITVLVGFSRIYLGVHWPSDVLGGWILGAVWAVIVSVIARWWLRRARASQAAAGQ